MSKFAFSVVDPKENRTGEIMSISIEEAHAFISDGKKAKEKWQKIAKRSWNEIKKRHKNGDLWSIDPNTIRKRARYPAWFSIFKIRQPLILSRVGVPICKDVTKDGNDHIGATAAILRERLAVSLARTFDLFDVLCSARDDFLATCFGMVRAYYEREEVKQEVKEYILPEQDPTTGEYQFVTSSGEVVQTDEIYQDDDGYYLKTEQVVGVEDEQVCLEPVLVTDDVVVDPDIRRWKRCKRLAFRHIYSRVEFKRMFGAKALSTLPDLDHTAYTVGANEAAPKKQDVCVWEYWDEYEKEVFWFVEGGRDFIKPVDYCMPDPEGEGEYEEQPNGLYNLKRFFPVPNPLIMNQATDEFWPTCEYYQVQEIIEDIHNIFSRMFTLTRAIRTRLLFDNSVDGLKEALNEAAESDAIGIDNLARALVDANGSLENVVQYIPVEKCIQALTELYQALEQRLGVLFKITGTSDLLQGLTTDNSGKTLGERQIEEKYAVNQIAEAQKKMAEFVRDCYELITEMALKNFKDSSLATLIMPQTLDEEHRDRYSAALGMLKQDTKRFRVELETDSTIALNEAYQKQQAMELVNALTATIEKVAATAQTAPELVAIELRCLKYAIQQSRQGKMFLEEVTQAIDQAVQNAEQQAQQPAPPDKDQVNADLKRQEMYMHEALEITKIQSDEKIAMIRAQVDQFRIQSDNAKSYQDQQIALQKLYSDIAEAREALAIKRDEVLTEFRKISSQAEAEQMRLQMEGQVKAFEMNLAAVESQLMQSKVMLDEREKYMTEARLQAEHDLETARFQVEQSIAAQDAIKERNQELLQAQLDREDKMNAMILEARKQDLEAKKQPAPAPPSTKKTIKVERDELGRPKSYQIDGHGGYAVLRDDLGNIQGYQPL